jgi:hypothetical protein
VDNSLNEICQNPAKRIRVTSNADARAPTCSIACHRMLLTLQELQHSVHNAVDATGVTAVCNHGEGLQGLEATEVLGRWKKKK